MKKLLFILSIISFSLTACIGGNNGETSSECSTEKECCSSDTTKTEKCCSSDTTKTVTEKSSCDTVAEEHDHNNSHSEDHSH